MAYETSLNGNGEFPFDMQKCSGFIAADAVPMASTTVTAAAGQYNNLDVVSNVGFRQNDVIEITGAGAGGTKQMNYVRSMGNSNTSASSVLICLRMQRPIVTAVTAQPVVQYGKVYTRFSPETVKIQNLSTGVSYEWFREMDINSCIKTAANGVRTVETESGIAISAFGFHFHPSMVGSSERAVFECTFR